MKVYRNQTKQSAESLGFGANFAFVSDERMSPKGIDVTPVRHSVRHLDGTYTYETYIYEVTEFNGKTAPYKGNERKRIRQIPCREGEGVVLELSTGAV